MTKRICVSCYVFYVVFPEDLSKSEDKEDVKREGEEGRGAKKTDEPEVDHESLIHLNGNISKHIFVLCFRLLKSLMSQRSPPPSRRRKATLPPGRRTERRSRQDSMRTRRRRLKMPKRSERRRTSLLKRKKATRRPRSRVKGQRASQTQSPKV